MELLDPATGKPLPSDSIQRVLFIANAAHVYNIPPLTSTRGYSASAWTADPARHIFTARLRLVETASEEAEEAGAEDALKVDLVLEDPSTGGLFAAAPYTEPGVVEPVLDSSRFFAVTVRDEQGRKAVLGVGFEERSDAFDFGVALQEARKSLGLGGEKRGGAPGASTSKVQQEKDYSLKVGETIKVNLGGTKTGRRRQGSSQQQQASSPSSASPSGDLKAFTLPPPPGPGASSAGGGSGGGFSLPPPPSAQDVKQKRRSVRDLGFDDGQFGEFA